MIENAISTAAPKTSPVIPPSRRTAKATRIRTAPSAAVLASGPSHQRPTKIAAPTRTNVAASHTATAAIADTEPDRGTEATRSGGRYAATAGDRQHRPRAADNQAGRDRSMQTVHHFGKSRRLRSQGQDQRNGPHRTDVTTLHDRQGPLRRAARPQAVHRIGESVQV